MGNKLKRYTVQAGERIDNLAVRIYGDPSKYILLLRANPQLDIWNPQPGMVVEAPDAR